MDPAWSCDDETWLAADGSVVELGFEAGFLGIEAFRYRYDGEDRDSWPTRIWYSFHPADVEPSAKPLVLFFNGGPAAATSSGLFAMNTGPHTLHPEVAQGNAIAENPNSWTRFANLLYVDTPDAGFSYSLRNPAGEPPPTAFVPEHEGALVLRFLLRFLARHPQLRATPVIVAGKSYGGTRATIMLRQILRPAELLSPEARYQDPLLADEVKSHLDRVHAADPNAADRQFGHQILIQPHLAGRFQLEAPSSQPPHSQCCCPEGEYKREQCDLAMYDQWYSSNEAAAAIVDPDVLAEMTGVDPLTIAWLHPAERTSAVRTCRQSADFGWPLVAALGALGPDDIYFCRFASIEGAGSIGAIRDTVYGEWFLENLLNVSTMITKAKFDIIVPGNAVPEALGQYRHIVSEVTIGPDSRSKGDRTGWILVKYHERPAGTALGERMVPFPYYSRAGHCVPARQPEDLLWDVEHWYEWQITRSGPAHR